MFDNTLSTKILAKSVRLENTSGTEKRQYNVGDTVRTSSVCPYVMQGKVTEVYKQNGYYYYIVSGKTLRTKDIEGRI